MFNPLMQRPGMRMPLAGSPFMGSGGMGNAYGQQMLAPGRLAQGPGLTPRPGGRMSHAAHQLASRSLPGALGLGPGGAPMTAVMRGGTRQAPPTMPTMGAAQRGSTVRQGPQLSKRDPHVYAPAARQHEMFGSSVRPGTQGQWSFNG